jgi:hypothetical protein
MLCTTTDPYQVIHHPDAERRRELAEHARFLVRRSLELIRDRSTLNVRILTRSALARRDFDLFRTFVDGSSGASRLVFGMSLPTLRNDLARVYEPHAPAPSQRLATLRAAREAGIPVFVAVAPTYPECDEADLRATLRAIAEIDPITVFHEPINIRSENVERIRTHADSIGVQVMTDVFRSREAWEAYAVGALRSVEAIAAEVGLSERLHLWPDKSLGTGKSLRHHPDPGQQMAWLRRWLESHQRMAGHAKTERARTMIVTTDPARISPRVGKLQAGAVARREHSIVVGSLPNHLQPSPDQFSALWEMHPLDYHEIKMHGRMVKTPRWQQAFGHDYAYTGRVNRALPIPTNLEPLVSWAREVVDTRLNGILVNWYDSALRHYIGRHRDSIIGLVEGLPHRHHLPGCGTHVPPAAVASQVGGTARGPPRNGRSGLRDALGNESCLHP